MVMFKLTPFSTSPRKRDDYVDFYDAIDDFFGSSPFRSLRNDTFKLDVKEEDKSYVIDADLPGVDREDIKVNYDDQTLIISVEHKEEKEEKDDNDNYLHRERRLCAMKRAIHLPDVDPSKVKAKLNNGVLQIIAEKAEHVNEGYAIDVE
jgi:HSP20 family protein